MRLRAGPVLRAVSNGVFSYRVLAVYEPLGVALDAFSVRERFGKYLHLWCPAVYDEEGNPCALLVVP